ncbi:MAG: GNAT family N-acetyltransferase [Chitinivibrionales bacterium]|nr:GNAT family N-acetyltransferase [Chitinivibrionales bacterium]
MDMISLKPLDQEHIDEAAHFVGLVMNPEEREYAYRTLVFHFGCRNSGYDDGRLYYMWQKDGSICGLAGLHRYVWGPMENAWLGWFGIAQNLRRKGFGRIVMQSVENRAVKVGIRKLFIETYSSPEFAAARAFYENVGFALSGKIPDYMPDGAALLVYYKRLW